MITLEYNEYSHHIEHAVAILVVLLHDGADGIAAKRTPRRLGHLRGRLLLRQAWSRLGLHAFSALQSVSRAALFFAGARRLAV